MTKEEVEIGIKRAIKRRDYDSVRIEEFFENSNESITSKLTKRKTLPTEFLLDLMGEFGRPLVSVIRSLSRLYDDKDINDCLKKALDCSLDDFENMLLEAVNNYKCPDCGRSMWSYTGENITEHSTFKSLLNGGINIITAGAVSDLLEVDSQKHIVYIACENCKHKIVG